jgi:hypothetical protein
MKIRFIFFSLIFFLVATTGYTQKKTDLKSIINSNVGINKYHVKEELERMKKGELLALYSERIKSIIVTLPYIAFTRMPGVTMADIGIPDSSDNTKALDTQHESTNIFLSATDSFDNAILPYADKGNLIAAILFYEETLKSLYVYSEFH